MKNKKITQEDLIPVLGVETRGGVGHYLSGRREINLSQFIKLANFIGASPCFLLGEVTDNVKAFFGAELTSIWIELTPENRIKLIEYARLLRLQSHQSFDLQEGTSQIAKVQ